jgi:hypothetical protein
MLGVAFIGLGGVNLVFLTVSPKFNTTSPMSTQPNFLFQVGITIATATFLLFASCFLIASEGQSGPKNVIFSNGLKIFFEWSNADACSLLKLILLFVGFLCM